MSQESQSAPVAETPSVQETTEQLIEEVGSPAVEDAVEASEAVETEEGAELEVSDAEQEAKEEEIRELKKKLKLKVNGKELEKEIDFNDEENLVKELQKAAAFDSKAEETAQYRKQLEAILGGLQSNPGALLAELGLDVDELAYNHLNRIVEEAQKSPEQIEQEKMKARLEELEAEREQLAQEKAHAEQERMKDEAAAQIQDQILGELDGYEGILSKDDPEVIGDIARAMYRYMQAGQDVDVKDVIPVVEERYLEKLRSRAQNWDEKTFNKIFGKKKMDELRKTRVKRKKAKTETARQIAETGVKTPEQPTEEGPKMSYRDFFKGMGR